MTYLYKLKKLLHFCIHINSILLFFILLFIFNSPVDCSVNLERSKSNSSQVGFRGGVFYTTSKHKEYGMNVISEHDSIRKALIYSPEENFVQIERHSDNYSQTDASLTFSEVAKKFRN